MVSVAEGIGWINKRIYNTSTKRKRLIADSLLFCCCTPPSLLLLHKPFLGLAWTRDKKEVLELKLTKRVFCIYVLFAVPPFFNPSLLFDWSFNNNPKTGQ